MKTKFDTLRSEAVNLVLSCGIPPNLIGHAYLAAASEMYASGKYSISDAYRAIAEQHNIKPRSVMRNITYAIRQGFNVAKRLSEITGISVGDDQLHNALVIAYLAVKLNEKSRS